MFYVIKKGILDRMAISLIIDGGSLRILFILFMIIAKLRLILILGASRLLLGLGCFCALAASMASLLFLCLSRLDLRK